MVGGRKKMNWKTMLGKRSEGDKWKKEKKEWNKEMVFLVTVLCASVGLMTQLSQIFRAR